MKIYLDVCCLNRPFDDQTQERIHLESEAILLILTYCRSGRWYLISSEVIEDEILRIPDDEKREKVRILNEMAKIKSGINTATEKRGLELEKLGFDGYDALHIACAESANADVILTADDKLLRQALQNRNILKVNVENPIKWLMEVFIK